MAETSLCTSDSSSAARASARSTPSPMAETSRRMAWPTDITDSVAAVSGCASRSATAAMDSATARISCERRMSEAST